MAGFFSIDWGDIEAKRLRFVPHPHADVSIAECGVEFRHLNLLKESRVLRNWTFVMEEAHRFVEDSGLRALLIESGKFLRKLILVSSDYRPWGAWPWSLGLHPGKRRQHRRRIAQLLRA